VTTIQQVLYLELIYIVIPIVKYSIQLCNISLFDNILIPIVPIILFLYNYDVIIFFAKCIESELNERIFEKDDS